MAKTVYSEFSFFFFLSLWLTVHIYKKKKNANKLFLFFFLLLSKCLVDWWWRLEKNHTSCLTLIWVNKRKKRSFFLWIGWRRASLRLSACTRPSLNECCIIMSLKNNKKVSILICAPNTTSCMLNCITQSWIDLSAIPGDKSRHEM